LKENGVKLLSCRWHPNGKSVSYIGPSSNHAVKDPSSISQLNEEGAMATLERHGIPVGGFTSVGQIHATNDQVFRRNQNAMGVAVELLATHTPGTPVVDETGGVRGLCQRV